MAQLFANNAVTTLNGAITAIATTITTTDGSVFPSPTGGDFFLATLSDGTNIEIVKCTSRSTNDLTVVRAQEGTTGFAFADLDDIEMRLTAGTLNGGKQTIFIPAGAMKSRTTNGAAAGSVETTTNKVMLESMDFDTATDEFVQFQVQMPKSWDASTVTAQFTWSHPTTTVNFGVRFFIQGLALVDGDAADTAFGTAVGHTADTGGTTDDIYITPETGAITIANSPAKSDYVIFQIYRDVSDAGDTLAVDARLHGVSLFYTTDALNDA